MPDMAELLYKIAVLAVPIVIAITFHEAAHGYVAWRLGDDTAYRLGRVTFNPVRHIDPIGTVLVPAAMYFASGFLFGWAKPVPVDFRRLDNPRRGMVWVALAGPGTNLALALVSVWLLTWTPLLGNPDVVAFAQQALSVSILINVILAVFNMLPLPPLDGGRVAVGLLPLALARPLAQLERYGLLILIGVLFILPTIGAQLGIDLNVLPVLLWPPVHFIIDLLQALVGP